MPPAPDSPVASDARTALLPASGGVRLLTGLNLAFLGILTLTLSLYLWPRWWHNPDLSHGVFMPAIFVLLVWESRRIGPARHPRLGAPLLAGAGVLALLSLASLAAAGLFAVSLGWSPNLVAFTLTAAFTIALLAALAILSAEPLRLVPLNWVSVVAAVLWLLTAPMPPGTYTRLTLALQTWVTGSVLTVLHLLGVAARQQGNLIELAGTTVGVEEACSGIRSLIACVFAGLFFSALLVRRPWGRAVLLILSAPLAIVMNFARSLTLTLLADRGVNIEGFWHNATGFAILAVTTGILAGLAFMLEPGRAARPPAPSPPVAGRAGKPAVFASQAMLAGFLVLAGALTEFFVLQTRPSRLAARPPPNLAALLPAAPAGWTVVTSGDLYRFADTLETEHLFQRTYYQGAGENLTQFTVYLAYWPPGRTSVSSVSIHTPDACWPGVGWEPVPATASRFAPVVAGRPLPPAEYRLFSSDGIRQHVWFWHLYDGVSITQRDPRSPRELLAGAWRYGFRRNGEQLFVRFSSNRPWVGFADDPLAAEILTNLRPFGL
jgi:exosortase